MLLTASKVTTPPRVDLTITGAPDGTQGVLRTNLCRSPGAEAGTWWWSGSLGTTAADMSVSYAGGSSIKLTTTTAGVSFFYTQSGVANMMPVGDRQTVHVSYMLMEGTAAAAGDTRFLWYDSTGTKLSETTVTYTAPKVGTWTQIDASAQAPAGASLLRVVAGESSRASGAVAWLDQILVESGTNGAYFDGSSAAKAGTSATGGQQIWYRWTGPAGESTSQELYGVSSTVATTVVTRSAGGTEQRVRGATGAVVGSTGFLQDYEAPTGVPITYQVTALNAGGQQIDQATITVPAIPNPAPGRLWLSDPLDATTPMLVQALDGTDAERRYDAQVQTVRAMGDRYPRAYLGSPQGAATYQLRLVATSPDEADQLRALLGRQMLCIRPPSYLHHDPVIYAVGGFTEHPVHWTDLGERPFRWTYEAELMITRGPSTTVILSAWTWQDVVNHYGTWQDLVGRYPTWTDTIRGD